MSVTDERTALTVTTLLERVAEIAPVLREQARASEDSGRLAGPSTDALRRAQLFRLWWPDALGGPGATLADGVRVLEALARAETAAAWNLAVGSVHAGFVGAYVDDVAVAEIFGGGEPVVAGQMAPLGTATRVTGGLRVTGRWSFGSGIHQSNWVIAGAKVAPENGGDAQAVVVVVPAAEVEVDEGSWQVAGLAGTGSCDYAITDVVVPAGRWFPFPVAERRRGHTTFDLPMPAQVMVHHAGFALGAGRRALEEITEIAETKVRAYSSGTVGHRSTFQRDLGQWRIRLDAARLHVLDIAERLQAAAGTGAAFHALVEARASARHATDVAVELAAWAYRSAGGSALKLDHALQRTMRDLYAATQHVYVDDEALTAFGASMLEVQR